MSDERSLRRISTALTRLMENSAIAEFARQQRERQEMLDGALGGPLRALHQGVSRSSALFAQDAFGPIREIQNAFENSALVKLQEQIRLASENTGIAKMMADINASTARLQEHLGHMRFDVLEFANVRLGDRIRFPAELKLSAMRDQKTQRLPLIEDLTFVPPQLREREPEPGEAAKILMALKSDFQALRKDLEGNPSKFVGMVATLSDRTEIYIETATNVGNLSVALTGLEIGSGNKRKLTVGIAMATFEVRVFDQRPKKPHLRVVDSEVEDE